MGIQPWPPRGWRSWRAWPVRAASTRDPAHGGHPRRPGHHEPRDNGRARSAGHARPGDHRSSRCLPSSILRRVPRRRGRSARSGRACIKPVRSFGHGGELDGLDRPVASLRRGEVAAEVAGFEVVGADVTPSAGRARSSPCAPSPRTTPGAPARAAAAGRRPWSDRPGTGSRRGACAATQVNSANRWARWLFTVAGAIVCARSPARPRTSVVARCSRHPPHHPGTARPTRGGCCPTWARTALLG